MCSLFTNTKFYQETPFIKPFLTIEEIKEEWYHVKNEEIHNIEINVLAIDGNTVIANWYLEQNNDVYDGIYQIMFNDKNDIAPFKNILNDMYAKDISKKVRSSLILKKQMVNLLEN